MSQKITANNEKEAIVIGAGIAGLSAAVYLGRAKINALVIGKPDESQAVKAHIIMNYLGFPDGISGKELIKKSLRQVKKYKVPVIREEVVNVQKDNYIFSVKTESGKLFKTKAIIISTGTPIKLSGIENEEQLTGKGVHYCVECDGAFYQKKKAAVIGNGNHAAEEALSLLLYTDDITIISNSDKFKFSDKLTSEISKKGIKLLNEPVKIFEGKTKLENVVLMSGEKLKFDGVFMGCGEFSALDFSSKLALKVENNTLVVDKNGMTDEAGVFAAGNCISRCRQVAKSVGDGCNAALSAIKFVRNKEAYQDYSKKKR